MCSTNMLGPPKRPEPKPKRTALTRTAGNDGMLAGNLNCFAEPVIENSPGERGQETVPWDGLASEPDPKGAIAVYHWL